MSSTEIATSVADTSLDSFSGSGETFWCVCANVCECVSDCLSLIHAADEHRDDWLISRYPGNVPSAKTALQCVFLCDSVFKNKGIYLNCQHIYMLCLLAPVCVCVCPHSTGSHVSEDWIMTCNALSLSVRWSDALSQWPSISTGCYPIGLSEPSFSHLPFSKETSHSHTHTLT